MAATSYILDASEFMRVFTTSDIHVDYEENRAWIANLSHEDYQSDLLILAGDISDDVRLVDWAFGELRRKFAGIFFVPGNHDLWVRRDTEMTSVDKFHHLLRLAQEHGVATQPFHHRTLSIVPLLGWYDYSFGRPGEQLLNSWLDFRACRWPSEMTAQEIAAYFLSLNRHVLSVENETIISFSHFLPRIDLMPSFVSEQFHFLYPALGSEVIDRQARLLKASRRLHVYGHSHLNRRVIIDHVEYINNAYGYPSEQSITRKDLLCIYQ